MTENAQFIHGKKYRCKVIEGSGWDRARSTRTPFYRLHLEVVGGDMEGAKLIREAYFTPKTEEGLIKEFNTALGVDLRSVNLRELDKATIGKECAAQCEIQKTQDGKRETIKAGFLLDVREMTVGGIESEVADLIGNKGTPEVNPDAYSDNF